MESEKPPVDLTGIESAFHDVVRAHGRELFCAVCNSGMVGQAVIILGQLVEKHHSMAGQKALGIIAAAYNQTVAQICDRFAWTPEQIAACDQDIKEAFATKIVVATPKIALQ